MKLTFKICKKKKKILKKGGGVIKKGGEGWVLLKI